MLTMFRRPVTLVSGNVYASSQENDFTVKAAKDCVSKNKLNVVFSIKKDETSFVSNPFQTTDLLNY